MAIQFKRGSTASRQASTEVLKAGQPFYDKGTHGIFIGDGKTSLQNLPGISPSHQLVVDESTGTLTIKMHGDSAGSTINLPDVFDLNTTYSDTTYAPPIDCLGVGGLNPDSFDQVVSSQPSFLVISDSDTFKTTLGKGFSSTVQGTSSTTIEQKLDYLKDNSGIYDLVDAFNVAMGYCSNTAAPAGFLARNWDALGVSSLGGANIAGSENLEPVMQYSYGFFQEHALTQSSILPMTSTIADDSGHIIAMYIPGDSSAFAAVCWNRAVAIVANILANMQSDLSSIANPLLIYMEGTSVNPADNSTGFIDNVSQYLYEQLGVDPAPLPEMIYNGGLIVQTQLQSWLETLDSLDKPICVCYNYADAETVVRTLTPYKDTFDYCMILDDYEDTLQIANNCAGFFQAHTDCALTYDAASNVAAIINEVKYVNQATNPINMSPCYVGLEAMLSSTNIPKTLSYTAVSSSSKLSFQPLDFAYYGSTKWNGSTVISEPIEPITITKILVEMDSKY